MPALDGLRAVAMVAIMAYHGGVPWARGAFLSVDAFFVLSGFLITSLLLQEWSVSGTVSLQRFWAGRARRLLPGLFVLLGGMALYAVTLAPPDTRAGLRLDGLATLLYVGNWHQILAGQSYFARQALPSPLQHTWTLAIEEQFYALWPLAVVAAARLRRPLRGVLMVAGSGALASALAMAVLYRPGTDPSRVYYGTDTHAQSLLVGAVLAVVLAMARPVVTARLRRVLGASSWVALAGLAWAWTHVTSQWAPLFRGGYLLVDALTAVALAGMVLLPGSVPARALSLRPVRYLGRISYGTYLWYWPVFLVLDHARTGLVGVPLLVLRMACTEVVAVLSYHLVELPVRQGRLPELRRLPLGRVLLRRVLLGRLRLGGLGQALAAAAVVVMALVAATGPPSAGATVAAGSAGALPSGLASPVPPVLRAARSAGLPADRAGGPGQGRPGAPGRPVRVEIVGDSVALTLAIGLYPYAAAYHVALTTGAIVGCGVVTGGPIDDRGQITQPLPVCASWQQRWAADVATVDPDVAVVLVGRWEALDRVHDGRWEHLGQPDFDAYVARQLRRGVQILSARGARVVLLTCPYFDSGEQPDGRPWPQEDLARIDRFNAILRRVAAQAPGVVRVVDLGAMLDPHGRFTPVVDGVTVRPSDGVHLTLAAGAWLAPKLLPQFAALAQRAAPGTAGGSTR